MQPRGSRQPCSEKYARRLCGVRKSRRTPLVASRAGAKAASRPRCSQWRRVQRLAACPVFRKGVRNRSSGTLLPVARPPRWPPGRRGRRPLPPTLTRSPKLAREITSGRAHAAGCSVGSPVGDFQLSAVTIADGSRRTDSSQSNGALSSAAEESVETASKRRGSRVARVFLAVGPAHDPRPLRPGGGRLAVASACGGAQGYDRNGLGAATCSTEPSDQLARHIDGGWNARVR